jgi:hypothetical protein
VFHAVGSFPRRAASLTAAQTMIMKDFHSIRGKSFMEGKSFAITGAFLAVI